MAKLPLEGIRVVELTTGAAGPTVARVLCEFGAEVIRCETRLRGDGHRGEDPAKWNKNPDFMKLQRGKKSFTVNMQTDKGRRLVRELVKISDVLVENYGLGILEKWGLDYPQLKEINPACILIRVKGMGCSGPHAADLTYGPNVGNTMATTYLWNYPGATTATRPRSCARATNRPLQYLGLSCSGRGVPFQASTSYMTTAPSGTDAALNWAKLGKPSVLAP